MTIFCQLWSHGYNPVKFESNSKYHFSRKSMWICCLQFVGCCFQIQFSQRHDKIGGWAKYSYHRYLHEACLCREWFSDNYITTAPYFCKACIEFIVIKNLSRSWCQYHMITIQIVSLVLINVYGIYCLVTYNQSNNQKYNRQMVDV